MPGRRLRNQAPQVPSWSFPPVCLHPNGGTICDHNGACGKFLGPGGRGRPEYVRALLASVIAMVRRQSLPTLVTSSVVPASWALT